MASLKSALKLKKCRNPKCRAEFMQARSMQTVCGIKCAQALTDAKKDRDRKAQDKIERAERKAAREKIKRPSEHMADAEKAVRDYRRVYELSIGSPCISCGKSQEEIIAAQGWKTGGAFDAGHWMGKGARPELRLEPMNIWLQCKGCNGGSAKYARKGESVKDGFEAGVIERIGQEAADALKADHRPRKYTVPELKAITAEYRAKTRELRRAQE